MSDTPNMEHGQSYCLNCNKDYYTYFQLASCPHDKRCLWDEDADGQKQCLLKQEHSGKHVYDWRELLNQPEPNVVVQEDGFCVAATPAAIS